MHFSLIWKILTHIPSSVTFSLQFHSHSKNFSPIFHLIWNFLLTFVQNFLALVYTKIFYKKNWTYPKSNQKSQNRYKICLKKTPNLYDSKLILEYNKQKSSGFIITRYIYQLRLLCIYVCIYMWVCFSLRTCLSIYVFIFLWNDLAWVCAWLDWNCWAFTIDDQREMEFVGAS